MMQDELAQRIAESPQFRTLVRSRLRRGCLLSLVISLLYTLFLLGMAYFPEFMGNLSMLGGTISLGIGLTIFLCFVCIALCWYYTWWANNRFDAMKEKYLSEMARADDAQHAAK